MRQVHEMGSHVRGNDDMYGIMYQLIPNPDHPPLAVTSIAAQCWREEGRWHFRYVVDGVAQLLLPDPVEPARADELWRTTCFEAFVGGSGTTYREYNFAPSGQWAAYAFDAPRSGMRHADEQAEVWLEGGESWIAVEAELTGEFASNAPLNLTVVVEETGGHKSYWALAHPAGPPDFHDRSCFIARLPE